MDLIRYIQGRTFTKEEAIELIEQIAIRTPEGLGPDAMVLIKSDRK